MCKVKRLRRQSSGATSTVPQQGFLIQTKVSTEIQDYAANVTLTNSFVFEEETAAPQQDGSLGTTSENTSTAPYEAIYTIDLPDIKSTIHKFGIQVHHLVQQEDKRWTTVKSETVEGKLKLKNEAKEEYSDSIAEGRQAVGLMEEDEQAPGRFSIKFMVGAFEAENGKKQLVKVDYTLSYVTEMELSLETLQSATAHSNESMMDLDDVKPDSWLMHKLPASIVPQYLRSSLSEAEKQKCQEYTTSILDSPNSLQVSGTAKLENGVLQVAVASLKVSTTASSFTAELAAGDEFTYEFPIIKLLLKPVKLPEVTALIERAPVQVAASSSSATTTGGGTEASDSLSSMDKFAVMIPISPSGHESPKLKNSEFIFLVDCSGSMAGKPIKEAARAVKLFLQSLPPSCHFNIYRFGTNYESLFPASVSFNEKHLTEAKKYVDNKMKANKRGTNIYAPLEAIYKNDPVTGKVRQIFLLTDGEVEDAEQVVQLIAANVKTTRLFSFGIGDQCDRKLVSDAAKAGEAYAEFVNGSIQLESIVIAQLKRAMLPAYSSIEVKWEALELTPGNVKPCFHHVPTVFHQSRHILYAFLDSIPSNLEQTVITVNAKSDNGEQVSFKVPLRFADNSSASPDESLVLHRLAARSKIVEMESNFKETNLAPHQVEQQVQKLSLTYGIASSQASFIAVSENYQAAPTAPPVSVQLEQSKGFTLSKRARAPTRLLSQMANFDTVLLSAGDSYSAPKKKRKEMKAKAADWDDNHLVSFAQQLGSQATAAAIAPSPILDKLLFAQKADGSWNYDVKLIDQMNISNREQSTIVENSNVFMTALVIVFLRAKFMNRRAEWELIEQRAVAFLKQAKDGTEQLKNAKTIVFQ